MIQESVSLKYILIFSLIFYKKIQISFHNKNQWVIYMDELHNGNILLDFILGNKICENIRIKPMSDKQQNNRKEQDQPQNQQQQQEQDPNALTEQDKKVYNEILSSINRMNSRVKQTKSKVEHTSEQKSANKRAQVEQITQKLIEAKQKSEIVNKQDLLTDVHHSFEEMVVEVYSENKQLKKKMESLVAIIKEQNKKITEHMNREENLKGENQKLRDQLMKLKDEHLLVGRTNPKNQNTAQRTINNRSKAPIHQNQSEDYDFWSMPQNQSSVKKRKDFVADSSLWVNDKDIDKSVFITEGTTKKR